MLRERLRLTEIYYKNFVGISNNPMVDMTGMRKLIFNFAILYTKKTKLACHLKERKRVGN